MIRAIRAELLKLRTARLPWGLLGVSVVLAGVHALLFDSNAGGTGHTAIKSLATQAGQTQAVTIPGEVLLFAAALGVIVASGEFRHNTATGTYLAIPDRARVLGAKAIAASGVGLVFGLAGAAVATAVGVGLGSLIRSQVGAIIAVFVWGLVIEQTVGSVYDAAQRYLPFTAAASLAGAKLEAGATPLPFAAATALVAAVAALVSLIAARTTLNADVT